MLVQGKEKEKECVVEDTRNKSSQGVVEEEGLLTTVDEEDIPLMIQVHGQRAWSSRPFSINVPTDPHRLVQA